MFQKIKCNKPNQTQKNTPPRPVLLDDSLFLLIIKSSWSLYFFFPSILSAISIPQLQYFNRYNRISINEVETQKFNCIDILLMSIFSEPLKLGLWLRTACSEISISLLLALPLLRKKIKFMPY